jgi:hypothetical protein
MNVKINQAEINFDAVNKGLEELSKSGSLNERKKLSDVLDQLREPLIQAFKRGVTFKALTAFLNANSISISESSLRLYINNSLGRQPRRGKKRQAYTRIQQDNIRTDSTSAQSVTPSETSQAWKKPLSGADQSDRKLPPRLRKKTLNTETK